MTKTKQHHLYLKFLMVALLIIVVFAVIIIIRRVDKKSNTISSMTSHQGSIKTTDHATTSNQPILTPGSITTSTQLISPSGTFVSNHKPNLSSSPAPNSEQSTCITTPQAKCTIQFTMNGSIKTLPSETTDSSGVASWNWTLQQVGLTSGSWSIEAIATLNNQTQTTQDQAPLEVSP